MLHSVSVRTDKSPQYSLMKTGHPLVRWCNDPRKQVNTTKKLDVQDLNMGQLVASPPATFVTKELVFSVQCFR